MANRDELAVRGAVRDALAGIPEGMPVLAACSGGADSLALAVATAFVASRAGRPAGGVIVDHGLQEGSAARARAVAAALVRLGLDPVEVVSVAVAALRAGPEGGARIARYAALDAAAERHGNAVVLLGHTRDDQAEGVLLGLARGSGARSLAGMSRRSGRYVRPLLRLPRTTVRAAVPVEMKPWDDPHNADPAYARSRVRHRLLPVLEAELGPGVTAALARTADLLRADADALDCWTDIAYETCASTEDDAERLGQGVAGHAREEGAPGEDESSGPISTGPRFSVERLLTLPWAVRSRVLRRAALAAGSRATDLDAAHVEAVDALLTRWRGQRGIDLPGHVQVTRSGDQLRFVRRS